MPRKPNKTFAVLCLSYRNWEVFVNKLTHNGRLEKYNKANRSIIDISNNVYIGFIEPDQIKGYEIDDYIIEDGGDFWTFKFKQLIEVAKTRLRNNG